MSLSVEGAAGANVSSAVSGTVNITTSGADRIVCLLIHSQQTSRPHVSSITSTSGITWHQRALLSYDASGVSPACLSNYELWWAYSSSPLTADTTTVTFSTSVDDATLCIFAVSGVPASRFASPFDGHVSLPATASDASGSFTNAAISFSTGSPDTLALAAWSAGAQNTGNNTTPPSGWASLINQTNTGGVNFGSKQQIYYRAFAAIQNNAAVNLGTTKNWGALVDAISGDAIKPRRSMYRAGF